ncbi:MAG: LysR family transcriptional regulator [Archangium sp.]
MDRLDAMETFLAVVDQHGFAPAARKLRRSAPTVTRQVAFLEERLGQRLLVRTTRSVTLTEAGTRYAENARRILSEVTEAEAAARTTRTTPAGRFVIAGPLVFGRLHLAPLMCRFLVKHPAVRGEVMLADRAVNLVEERIDLTVRIGHLADSSLIARKVGQTRRVLVASPKYLAKQGTPKDPAELQRHALIHFTGLSTSPEWRFTKRGKERLVRFEPALSTNSADVALQHAALSGGLALLLAYQVEAQLASGALVAVLRDFEPEPVPIHCLYPAARLVPVNTRAFLDMIATQRWVFGG